jgi:hypothetical protein
MIDKEQILAALDKPRTLSSIKQREDPSSKSADALQDLLITMRAEGKVKFDINNGRWSKA